MILYAYIPISTAVQGLWLDLREAMLAIFAVLIADSA